MKRTILFSLCLLLCTATFAQPHQSGKEGQKNKYDRIRAEKIAFFTDRLDLTPQEAQVFWPVYNEYWKESQKAHKATMQAFGATKAKNGETIDAKELEKMLDAYIELSKEEFKVKESFHSKFKEVLPIGKVAELYQAEEAFRMKMLHSFKRTPDGRRNGKMHGAAVKSSEK
ncbi:MAG: hypothetical protein KBS38_04500 [Bacteroidales bacterium]|nr:hypothetical protein [Candidatus Cacconaster caballi]